MLDREICSVQTNQPEQEELLELLKKEKSNANEYLKTVLQDGEIRGAKFNSCLIDKY